MNPFADPASLKRFATFLVSAAVVAASPLLAKYGLPTPSDAQVGWFVALVLGFIGQSAARSIVADHIAGKAAAAAVDTTAKADAVITAAIASSTVADPAATPKVMP
jgi:hypothetical protein